MKIKIKDLVYLGDDIYRTVRAVDFRKHTKIVRLNSPTNIPFMVSRKDIKKVYRLVTK